MRPLSHFQTHCCGGAMMKLNFFGKITTGTSTLFLHFMLLSVKVNLTIFPPIFLLPFFQFLLSSSQAWQMRVLSNVFWWLIERWWWRKKSLSSLIKINFWKIDWKVGVFDHFLNLISDQCVGFLKRAWGYCFHYHHSFDFLWMTMRSNVKQ